MATTNGAVRASQMDVSILKPFGFEKNKIVIDEDKYKQQKSSPKAYNNTKLRFDTQQAEEFRKNNFKLSAEVIKDLVGGRISTERLQQMELKKVPNKVVIKSFVEALSSFYAVHCPDMIPTVPLLAEKHKGKELLVVANLEKRYRAKFPAYTLNQPIESSASNQLVSHHQILSKNHAMQERSVIAAKVLKENIQQVCLFSKIV